MAAAAAWRCMQMASARDAEEAMPPSHESFDEIMSQLDRTAAVREFEACDLAMQGSSKQRKIVTTAKPLHQKPFYNRQIPGGEFDRVKPLRQKDLSPWDIQRATAPERSWPTASSDYQHYPLSPASSNRAAQASPARNRHSVSRSDGFASNYRVTSEGVASTNHNVMTQRPEGGDFYHTRPVEEDSSLQKHLRQMAQRQKQQIEWQRQQDLKRVQQKEKVYDEEEDKEAAWQQMLLEEHLQQQKRQQEQHQQFQPPQQLRRRRLPQAIHVEDEILTPVKQTPVHTPGASPTARSISSPANTKMPQPKVGAEDPKTEKLNVLQKQMNQMAKQIAALQAADSCNKVVEEYGSATNSPKGASDVQLLVERRQMLARELAETDRCLRGVQATSPQRRAPPLPKQNESCRGGPFAGPRGVHNRTDSFRWDHKLNNVSKTTYNYLGPGTDGDPGPAMHPLWS